MKPHVVKQIIQELTDMAENYLNVGEIEKASEIMDMVENIDADDSTNNFNIVSLDIARARRNDRKKNS